MTDAGDGTIPDFGRAHVARSPPPPLPILLVPFRLMDYLLAAYSSLLTALTVACPGHGLQPHPSEYPEPFIRNCGLPQRQPMKAAIRRPSRSSFWIPRAMANAAAPNPSANPITGRARGRRATPRGLRRRRSC